MPFHKFGPNDIFYNRIETHPQVSFIIYDTNIYYNNSPRESGSFVNNAGMVPTGYVSLYELNVDRKSGNLIYPFVTKAGSLISFKTATTSEFNNDFAYGDTIKSTYPLAAGITKDRYAQGAGRSYIKALKNTLNYHTKLSHHYAYSSVRVSGEIRVGGVGKTPASLDLKLDNFLSIITRS